MTEQHLTLSVAGAVAWTAGITFALIAFAVLARLGEERDLRARRRTAVTGVLTLAAAAVVFAFPAFDRDEPPVVFADGQPIASILLGTDPLPTPDVPVVAEGPDATATTRDETARRRTTGRGPRL